MEAKELEERGFYPTPRLRWNENILEQLYVNQYTGQARWTVIPKKEE